MWILLRVSRNPGFLNLGFFFAFQGKTCRKTRELPLFFLLGTQHTEHHPFNIFSGNVYSTKTPLMNVIVLSLNSRINLFGKSRSV
jgi:hypothetical protein